jgi:ABC-type Mn2+/Zn2+ transport system permease subunit
MSLIEPLAEPAVMRGLIAALMVGTIVPILGCYVVLKGMAFLGDALAHIILPGVVVAVLLDIPLLAGALVAGILAALMISAITKSTVIKEDAAIGVVFAASLALGVAILSTRSDYDEELTHILFGELLGVTRNDLWLMAGLGLVTLLAVVAFYKEFLVLSFDRVLATTMQLPVSFLNNLLMVLLAVVIVISLRAVGVALVLAMLVTPAASAYLLTRRLPTMMLWASLIGAVSGAVGLYLSYYLEIASGAAIVLVASLFFGLAYLVAPRRGLLLRQKASEP